MAMTSCVAPDARNPQLAIAATPGDTPGNHAAKSRKAIMQTFAAAGASRDAPRIVGVQRPLVEREDRNESDIGEHDPRHRNRIGEFLRLADEARRGQPDEERHVEIDEAEQHDLRENEKREDLACEAARLLAALGRSSTRV